LFAPGEKFENFLGGDRLDVAVDVRLKIAQGATAGLNGAFLHSPEAQVPLLEVYRWLTAGVMGREG